MGYPINFHFLYGVSSYENNIYLNNSFYYIKLYLISCDGKALLIRFVSLFER